MAIPNATEEELSYIKNAILYVVLMDVLERDLKIIGTGKPSVKIPEFYAALISQLQTKINVDMAENRALLRQHGMKIIQQQRTKEGIEAVYLCRGYQNGFNMVWRYVRAELKVKLFDYIGLNIKDDTEA